MNKVDNRESRYTSLQNALRLLAEFSIDEPELGISELAERLGVAKSTIHRLLQTMAGEGFVVKDPKTNLYRLGASILSLGHVVTSNMKLYQESLPVLKTLVQKSREAAHVCVIQGMDVFYINKVECDHPVRLLSHIGKRNPIHCTSSGQAILAFQPPDAVERVIAAGLVRFTRKTITSPDQFRRLMERIRAQGYAISVEELHEGVTSIGAPVRNAKGQVIASVNIAGPIQRITDESIPHLVKLVTLAAEEVSIRLAQR